MAISPSHSLWQRERLEHHSGAQRHYGDHSLTFPRGPSASPVVCTLCNHGSVSAKGSGSSISCSTSKENLNPVFLNRSTAKMGSKKTFPRAANHPSCCTAEGFSSKCPQYNWLNSVCQWKIRNFWSLNHLHIQLILRWSELNGINSANSWSWNNLGMCVTL